MPTLTEARKSVIGYFSNGCCAFSLSTASASATNAHGIFGRHPAAPLPFHEGRHLVLDGGGADHLRVPHLDPDRSFGVRIRIELHYKRAELVIRPVVVAHSAASR